MQLDELPELVLHKICLELEAPDIESVQNTNRRLFDHVRSNRLYYKKKEVISLSFALTMETNGHSSVDVKWKKRNGTKATKTFEGSVVDDTVNSLNPNKIISSDQDALFNMSPLWWRERTMIELYNIVDIRRYLPYFDRCRDICLESSNRMNLSEILGSMETKNLRSFSVSGSGGLECTNEDIRKIGRLSNKMILLDLKNISESSNISNNAIAYMIKTGSFAIYSFMRLPVNKGMLRCLARRNLQVEYIPREDIYKITRSRSVICITNSKKKEERRIVFSGPFPEINYSLLKPKYPR